MARKKQQKQASRVAPVVKLSVTPSTGVSTPTPTINVQNELALTEVKEPLAEKILKGSEKVSLAILGAGCIVLFQNVVTQIQAHPSQYQEIIRQNALVVFIAIILLIIGAFSLWRKRRIKRAAKHVSQQKVPVSQAAPTEVGIWGLITREWRRVFAHPVFSPLLSITTTLLFVALLVLVLSRPAWCPSLICQPAQTKIATYPGGASDQNLDAYFLKYQSNFFALPGNLQQYNLENLPQNVGAVRSDGLSAAPYRLVIGVQNLHQTGAGYEIYIDAVVMVVQSLPLLDDPLHVWNASSLVYTTAPYSLTYSGQLAGSQLAARYQPFPQVTGVRQQLQLSESDDIDLQIMPAHNLHAYLKFQVKIIYSVANQRGEYSLTLPNHFEMVFSTANNWHLQTF